MWASLLPLVLGLNSIQDPSAPGAYIQRSMRLLAESTPEKPAEVRILFYGQSITVQDWWRRVESDLRRRYPHARIVVENRAIGGFAANLLGRIALLDVVPFRPDLVILHDYGGEPDYEAMVRSIRRATTAELLLQTDHHTFFPGPSTSEKERQGYEWHNAHVGWMKDLGRRLQCGVVDVRKAWKSHLDQSGLLPEELLSDSVHLNKAGEDLMAKIVTSHLVRDPNQPEGLPSGSITEKKPRWSEKVGQVDFVGNRIDVLGSAMGARFLIDGKPASSFPGCTAFSRPSNAHGAWFPALIGVRSELAPLLEEWSATLSGISEDGRVFDFAVEGSVTGPDGQGRSDRSFRSTSGRILIDPADWAVGYAKAVSGESTPEGFQVKWRTFPLYRETAALSREWITIAQGLPNGKHTLEIVTDQPPGVVAVRVYKPPVP